MGNMRGENARCTCVNGMEMEMGWRERERERERENENSSTSVRNGGACLSLSVKAPTWPVCGNRQKTNAEYVRAARTSIPCFQVAVDGARTAPSYPYPGNYRGAMIDGNLEQRMGLMMS